MLTSLVNFRRASNQVRQYQGRTSHLLTKLNLTSLEARVQPALYWVTTLADAGAGSFRDLLDHTNATTEADEIRFNSYVAGSRIASPAHDTLNPYAYGPTAFVVTGDLTISGDPLLGITFDGLGKQRLFAVSSSASLTLRDATLTGGVVAAGNGGDVFNLHGGGGGGAGAFGGAIFNQGTLVIERCLFTDNSAIGGNGGVGTLGGVLSAAGGGGVGGNGGSVHINFFAGNSGAGGGGVAGAGEDSRLEFVGGAGGANEFGVQVVSANTNLGKIQVDVPSGTSGGGGAGTPHEPVLFNIGGGNGTSLSSGGFGGGGGGGYTYGGDAGFGGGGGGNSGNVGDMPRAGNGGFGGGGGGSGNWFDSLGGGGRGGYGAGNGGENLDSRDLQLGGGGGGGGGAGLGGAIFNNGGSVRITNSTFYSNTAQGGAGGKSALNNSQNPWRNPGSPGSGRGGAIFNRNGSIHIENSTFASNSAQNGDGSSGYGVSFFNLEDGGFANTEVKNTLIADVANSVSSEGNQATTFFYGNNLITGFTFTFSGSHVSHENSPLQGNPLVSPLGDHGGPTQTVALLAGSPAINAGIGTAIAVDQRGYTRSDGAIDIGAFESRGFSMTITGGNNQFVDIASGNFLQSLDLVLTANDIGVPISGVTIQFNTPVSGPSATISTVSPVTGNAYSLSVVTDAYGKASIFARSNAVPGTFLITASTKQNQVQFHLSNAIPQTITFAPLADVVYGVSPLVLSATSDSGLPVGFTVISGPGSLYGNLLTILGAGDIILEARQPGDPTHAPAPSVRRTLHVAKASQSIQFTPKNATFGDAPRTLSATSSVGLPVAFTLISGPAQLSGNSLTITGAGDVVIEAYQSGDLNYEAVTLRRTMSVNRATQSIQFTLPTTAAFGDSPLPLMAVASSGLSVSFTVIAGPGFLDYGKLRIDGSGIIEVEASQSGNSNYEAAPPVRRTVQVSKQNQVVLFNPTPIVPNKPDANVPLVATAGPGQVVTFRILSGPGILVGSKLLPTGVGTVRVIAETAGDANYFGASVQADVAFVSTVQTISFSLPTIVTYGVSPLSLAASVPSGLPVAFQVISGPGVIQRGQLVVQGAGNIVIAASQAGDATYDPAEVIKTVIVAKAPLILIANSVAVQVGQPVPPLTFNAVGLVNGDGLSAVTGVSLTSSGLSTPSAGNYPITFSGGTAANYNLNFVPGTLTRIAKPSALVGETRFAVGADAGLAQPVTIYSVSGNALLTTNAFPGFTGGTRVAMTDVNGDGIPDLIAGTGPGSASNVTVLDGRDGHALFTVAPFESSFAGGVFVAGGDFNGDGVGDIVISPDQGGGPRVQVYSGAGFIKVADFFAIEDPNFFGGVRTAIGDVNGDGAGELVVAAGFGGGPRIATFDGRSLVSTPRKLFGDFFAYESTLTNGVYITVGDVDGDGRADVIAGGGPGGGPRVSAFSATSLIASAPNRFVDFFVGNPDDRGGVRVAAKNLDNDAHADIVVGAGVGSGSRVQAFLGASLGTASMNFDAFPGFAGGVFVG